MNYVEIHLGDYAEATNHLSFAEDGAYWRLMRKYYAHENPLPVEIAAVQRLVCARTREDRIAVETILREFFELREDGWHQKRCDAELAKFQAKREQARNAGLASVEAKRQRNANCRSTVVEFSLERNGNLPNHQTPEPSNQEHKTLTPMSGNPDVAPQKKARKANGNGHSHPSLAGIDLREKPPPGREALYLLAFLNQATGHRFEAVEANLRLCRARLSEYGLKRLKAMIVNRWEAWESDEKMHDYLRPATLFNAEKCAQYIGKIPAESVDG